MAGPRRSKQFHVTRNNPEVMAYQCSLKIMHVHELKLRAAGVRARMLQTRTDVQFRCDEIDVSNLGEERSYLMI